MSIASFTRRNIFIPLNIYKDKSPRLKYAKEMERTQYVPLDELRTIQFDRIKTIIRLAYNDSPYYRGIFDKYNVHPNDIQDIDDLAKIPILTKNDIQENMEGIITRKVDRERLILFKTGGSTGNSLIVYKEFEGMEREVGSAYRSFKWAGWKIGEPVGRVWGNPPVYHGAKARLRDILLYPTIYLDTMNITDSTMDEFVNRWERMKPTLLHGHAHSLYIFSQYCTTNNIHRIQPKAIISTSMMLMKNERESIEKAFACKVTDLYGCEEVGLIACECEKHCGMHINMENAYVEFLDSKGSPVENGQEGALVVTSLINRAMPLIRYKIEDVGIPSGSQCTCGRSLPLLDKVSGRVADFLVKKNGSLVAGVSIVERTLTAFPGIKQMQIVQENIDEILINIVKGKHYNNAIENSIKTEIRNIMGEGINIIIQHQEHINQEKTGKYRFAISKVRNPFIN